MKHTIYRCKYRFGQYLPLTSPVDISLELSSFCNQHCSYCLDPATPVLTKDYKWIPIGEIKEGQQIIAFDEFLVSGNSERNTQIATVEKIWVTKKPAIRIITEKSEIICSLDHRFLDGSGQWRESYAFKIGDEMLFSTDHIKDSIVKIELLGDRDLVDIQTSTKTFYAAGYATHNCYHADKKNLPFKQRFMDYFVAEKILIEGAELGVHSVKTNWRGESTMNPHFAKITALAKDLAKGSTYLERLTNSNFKFDSDNKSIFEGLANQTKVKVSYDSFIPEVFETQRAGGDHAITTKNIDIFYNMPGRKSEIVIQAVRTQLNKDEDLEGQVRKRWPSATLSVRDVVGGRKKDDINDLIVNDRDGSERQSCLQAHVRLIFDTFGRAFPCCPDIKGELPLGNINSAHMEDIFNGAKAKKLRKMLKDKSAFDQLSVCKNCSSLETFKGFKPNWNS